MTRKKISKKSHLAHVIDRNITTLLEVRRQLDRQRSFQTRFADGIAAVCGKPAYAYAHVVWFSLWILWNTGQLGFPIFDPFPFGFLTMIVSLEAIFLSTFVLISQNYLADMGEQRSDLDLQVNLLAEYEITKVLQIVDAIADHLGLREGNDAELDDLKEEILPEQLLRAMEVHKKKVNLLLAIPR